MQSDAGIPADSLVLELGPCHVNEKLETYINPHSWSEVSNMLFISQPLGTGKQSLITIARRPHAEASQVSHTLRRERDHSTPLPVHSKMPHSQASRAATRSSMPL